jgi:hypothetical protein
MVVVDKMELDVFHYQLAVVHQMVAVDLIALNIINEKFILFLSFLDIFFLKFNKYLK